VETKHFHFSLDILSKVGHWCQVLEKLSGANVKVKSGVGGDAAIPRIHRFSFTTIINQKTYSSNQRQLLQLDETLK